MILKKKKRNENERESGFISNTTMHLVSTDRVGNTFHVSLLFIQGYTSTKDNRIFYSAVSLIFVKKKEVGQTECMDRGKKGETLKKRTGTIILITDSTWYQTKS